jgi:hypothetical protein
MMVKQPPVPAFQSDVVIGVGFSILAFLVPGREFRYGTAYVSEMLGYSENYFRKTLSRSTKKPSKKLKCLKSKGFTAYQIRVKAPRKEGGATVADTIGYDDFAIWIEYEAVVEKNPIAIALLTASFREILLDRTQRAFNLPEIPHEQKIQEFKFSVEERQALWESDQADLEQLHLPGDEDGYELIPEEYLSLLPYSRLLESYGIDSLV